MGALSVKLYGIGAIFLLATTDGRSLVLTGHAVVLGRLTAVAVVSWCGDLHI